MSLNRGIINEAIGPTPHHSTKLCCSERKNYLKSENHDMVEGTRIGDGITVCLLFRAECVYCSELSMSCNRIGDGCCTKLFKGIDGIGGK
jgi:hypothetical protein